MNTEEKKKNNVEIVTDTQTDLENTSAETSEIGGVPKEVLNKVASTHTKSNETAQADAKAQNNLSRLESVTSKDSIVSEDTRKVINSQFKTPGAVTQADAYLKSQLSKIQSGKTSYTDQIKDMMSQIQNRDKFSYDVDSDPLFQQALASAMNSGRSAMQDTIGQASALTGGYGSSYATSAANQAYNSFIEDAYDNLPQYYQMALEAYQMEGDEMYRQLDMLNTADSTEYGRMLNAYDATSAHRNQMYNEAYQQFRDIKSDAYSNANLQINEHGQLVSDAYNLYNATSSYANTLYERDYTKWADEVSQAMKYAEMLNSEYWSDKNFKEGVRQYDETMTFNKEQAALDEDYRRDALAQDESQFNRTMEYNKEKEATAALYDGYINPDDIDVDENGNIIKIEGYNIAGANSSKTTTVDGFRTDKGDNFEVTLGDKSYKVENRGKVDDDTTITSLNGAPSYGPITIYNNEAYLKYGTDYYKLGNQATKSGYTDLLLALQN